MYSLIVGLLAVGIPYLALAALLRRLLGAFGLALLALVVAGVFVWVILTDHSVPHGATFWMAIGTVAVVTLSPLATIDAMGRSDAPPPLWARMGLGFVTMVATGVVAAVIAVLMLAVGVR